MTIVEHILTLKSLPVAHREDYLMDFMDDEPKKMCEMALKLLSWVDIFGLRGFPGETFRINVDKSYDANEGRSMPRSMQVVVDVKRPEGWVNFTRTTPDELAKEIVTI